MTTSKMKNDEGLIAKVNDDNRITTYKVDPGN